mmetsp:Transcript_28959/g.61186  ORF Transcript_28959/g.61186 Transcript_28959/m.61186 type:complete len:137 (-) Transcript_28959:234-644(-)
MNHFSILKRKRQTIGTYIVKMWNIVRSKSSHDKLCCDKNFVHLRYISCVSYYCACSGYSSNLRNISKKVNEWGNNVRWCPDSQFFYRAGLWKLSEQFMMLSAWQSGNLDHAIFIALFDGVGTIIGMAGRGKQNDAF